MESCAGRAYPIDRSGWHLHGSGRSRIHYCRRIGCSGRQSQLWSIPMPVLKSSRVFVATETNMAYGKSVNSSARCKTRFYRRGRQGGKIRCGIGVGSHFLVALCCACVSQPIYRSGSALSHRGVHDKIVRSLCQSSYSSPVVAPRKTAHPVDTKINTSKAYQIGTVCLTGRSFTDKTANGETFNIAADGCSSRLAS